MRISELAENSLGIFQFSLQFRSIIEKYREEADFVYSQKS